MIYQVIEWVYYVCCMVCMVCVGEWTFHWSVKDKKRYVMAGVIYAIGFLFLQIQSNGKIPFFLLFYVTEIVAWALITKGNLRNRLSKIVIIFCAVGVVKDGVVLILEVVLQDKVTDEMLQLVAILLSMIGLAIITRRKWYKKLVVSMQALPQRGARLILWTVIVGIALVSYGNMVQELVQVNRMGIIYRILLMTEFLMVVGIVVWLVVESNQKKYYLEQNVLKEEILHTQQEYYKIIYEKDKEMRSFRHDVTNQLGILKLFLRNGDIESAKVQLESIHTAFEDASFQKIHVGDEMLDAILSMMKQKSEEKNVRLEVIGKIESERKYSSYELCAIFSNAISNAIEACVRMEDSGPVCVNILDEKNTLFCTVENPATEEMYRQIQQGGTSKDDVENHGYGVANIRRAVKRLNGELEYYYKDGNIKLEIYI